jgi:hypothetical protein
MENAPLIKSLDSRKRRGIVSGSEQALQGKGGQGGVDLGNARATLGTLARPSFCSRRQTQRRGSELQFGSSHSLTVCNKTTKIYPTRLLHLRSSTLTDTTNNDRQRSHRRQEGAAAPNQLFVPPSAAADTGSDLAVRAAVHPHRGHHSGTQPTIHGDLRQGRGIANTSRDSMSS